MKTLIHICKENENGSLTVIGEKKLFETLDKNTMELTVKYHGKSYKVQGNAFFQYIIL